MQIGHDGSHPGGGTHRSRNDSTTTASPGHTGADSERKRPAWRFRRRVHAHPGSRGCEKFQFLIAGRLGFETL
jgi:hypothetical protein